MAVIDGMWHKKITTQAGYHQWVRCDSILLNRAKILKDDLSHGLGIDADALAVNKVLHLIDGIFPKDFVAYLRDEAKGVETKHNRGGMGLKLHREGDGIHILISLENRFYSSGLLV